MWCPRHEMLVPTDVIEVAGALANDVDCMHAVVGDGYSIILCMFIGEEMNNRPVLSALAVRRNKCSPA
jgi:hypothetical protein